MSTQLNYPCPACKPIMVNGILSHEQNCPMPWPPPGKECDICGRDIGLLECYQLICCTCLQNAPKPPQTPRHAHGSPSAGNHPPLADAGSGATL